MKPALPDTTHSSTFVRRESRFGTAQLELMLIFCEGSCAGDATGFEVNETEGEGKEKGYVR